MSKQNRYNQDTRWVPAATSTSQPLQVDIIDATTVSNTPATIHVESPLRALDGATERTSGLDRSYALVIRLIPFTVGWLVLAIGVSWATAMGGAFTLILFSGLTACTYGWLDRQERQFSRNGIERYKIDTLADLKLAEMKHAQELRRMALTAHLKMLGVHDEDD